MAEKPSESLPIQTNYKTALRMARERLRGMDFEAQCVKAGAEVVESGALIMFIGREFFVDRETLEVSARNGGEETEVWEKIIILHYLIAADGSPDTGELITYQQIKDGAPYYPVFNRRTGGILLSAFGGRLPELLAAAGKIGAREEKGLGESAFRVRALPRVEYVFACYPADDEFPAEIRVLFDSSIARRLPAEDITVLGQMICIKIARAG